MKFNNLLKASRHFVLASRKWCTYPRPFMHFLMNLPQAEVDCLCNGLRITTLENDSDTASVNLFIDAGSRYEHPKERGMSHLIEHLIVKDVEKLLTSTGARFKCHAERELVHISTECNCMDVPGVINLLLNTVFMNQLSEAEIAYQKKIILMEMCQRDFDYYNLTLDYLHSTAFQGTPLGLSIMGNSERICSFEKKPLVTFYKRIWSLRRAVLVVVGGVKRNIVTKAADDTVGREQCHYFDEQIIYRYTGSDVRFRNDALPEANIAIAVEGPSFLHPDKLYMDVAMHCISGWHKSQGFAENHSNVLSRAAYYFSEGYKAFNITYQDTSLWGVHFVSHSLKTDDMVANIIYRWITLSTSISTGEIERAKTEMKSRLLYDTQTNAGAAKLIGKSFLYKGIIPNLFDLVNEIDKVTVYDVRNACLKYIYDKCPVVAAVGPVEGLKDYVRIRASMYWLRY